MKTLKKNPYLLFIFFYVILFLQSFFWISSPKIPFPHLIPEAFYSIGEFISLNSLYRIFIATRNSILISMLTCLITLFFMLPLALLLTLGPKRPSPLLHFILYLPILSSALIPCFGLYEEFLKLSFIATPLGVSLAQSCFLYPYILRPLEIELKKDNYHRERSALDIGLSLPKIFFFVTLPKLKGSLFTGLFFVFFGSYNDYLIPFLIGDAQISTLPLELYPLIFSGDRALSTVFILIYLIPLLLSLFLLRPFRSLYARS